MVTNVCSLLVRTIRPVIDLFFATLLRGILFWPKPPDTAIRLQQVDKCNQGKLIGKGCYTQQYAWGPGT